MKAEHVKDDLSGVLFTKEQIAEKVRDLAQQIADDCGGLYTPALRNPALRAVIRTNPDAGRAAADSDARRTSSATSPPPAGANNCASSTTTSAGYQCSRGASNSADRKEKVARMASGIAR